MSISGGVRESSGRGGVRGLLTAAGLSALSAGILGVANDLVAVLALDAGPAQIGALNAIESASFVFLSVPVGWWLDRIDRRQALQWTQVLATLALVSIPVAWLAGVLSFWHLAVASFLVGTAGMVWNLGLGALIPSVAGKARAAATFSRKQGVETAASLVSPGLTGLALMVIASPLVLFFAAVLELAAGLVLRFSARASPPGAAPGEVSDVPDAAGASPEAGSAEAVLSDAAVAGARSPETESEPDADAGSAAGERAVADPAPEAKPRFWEGVREGFRFVVRTKPILVSTLNAMVLNASLALAAAVTTVYEIRVLGFTPALIGLNGVAIAVGGLVGAALGGRILERRPGVPVAAVSIAIAGASTLLVPLAALPGLVGAVVLIVVHSLIWNSAVVVSNAGLYGVLTELTPDRLLGRVQSFRMLVALGPLPLFGLLGGALGEWWGVMPVLWIYVALAFVAVGLTSVLWRMSAREGWGRLGPGGDKTA